MAPRESITPPESITLARGKTLGCSVAAPPQSHRGVRRDILFYLRQLPIDGCTHAHWICDFGNDCGQLSNFLFGHSGLIQPVMRSTGAISMLPLCWPAVLQVASRGCQSFSPPGESGIEQLDYFIHPKLGRPAFQASIPCDLIMLHGLGRGDDTCI